MAFELATTANGSIFQNVVKIHQGVSRYSPSQKRGAYYACNTLTIVFVEILCVPQQVNRHVEEALVAYRRAESERLAHEMPPKDITLTQDETFTGGLCLVGIEPVSNSILLEQTAQARDHDTWQVLMEQALMGINCTGIQSTSDEAPGLLASVEHHLGAHHSPDLFHVQHELSKAVSAPMAAKQRAAHKAVMQAEETLHRMHERLDNTHGEPPQRGPGRPTKVAVGLEQVAQDVEAARQESQRLTRQREQVSPSNPRYRPCRPFCRFRTRCAAQRPAHCQRYPAAP